MEVAAVDVSSRRERPPLPCSLSALLVERFGPRFLTTEAVCLQRGTDESPYPPAPPDAVVFATSTQGRGGPGHRLRRRWCSGHPFRGRFVGRRAPAGGARRRVRRPLTHGQGAGNPSGRPDRFPGVQRLVCRSAGAGRDARRGRGGSRWGGFQWALRPEERTRLWTPPHHAYFACLQRKPGCRSFTTDACVPISALAECIAETLADIRECGLMAPVFGHVGDGNFHCLLLVTSAAERQLAETVSQRLMRRALRFEGTCTCEHGVGLHKMACLEEEHGPDALGLMRRIKQVLDPHNILNPGKVVEPAC